MLLFLTVGILLLLTVNVLLLPTMLFLVLLEKIVLLLPRIIFFLLMKILLLLLPTILVLLIPTILVLLFPKTLAFIFLTIIVLWLMHYRTNNYVQHLVLSFVTTLEHFSFIILSREERIHFIFEERVGIGRINYGITLLIKNITS